MYLTGGQFKGHKIETPKNTRPTLSKVRESVFNVLFSYFENQGTFLDMFAGSSIMGLEAVSRGYTVTELEINPKTADVIKINYKKIKQKANIIVCDALKYKCENRFDVIYIDPPWQDEYKKILQKASELLNNDGIMVVEYDLKGCTNINKISGELNLNVIKEKKYGRTLISFISLK